MQAALNEAQQSSRLWPATVSLTCDAGVVDAYSAPAMHEVGKARWEAVAQLPQGIHLVKGFVQAHKQQTARPESQVRMVKVLQGMIHDVSFRRI